MNRSESLKELAASLAKAQATMKAAIRDHENPHFKSRFADLASVWEACREPLTSNGLAVLQPASAEGNAVTVTTTLLHASGEWLSEPLTMAARDASPQSIGSAVTYARRYGLAAMVGICPEDDDGEAATDHHAPPAASRRPLAPTDPPRPPRQQGNGQSHDQYDGRPPTSGRGLFAWVKEQEQRFDVPLLKELNAYAKRMGYPGKMTEFDPGQVKVAHQAALEILRMNRSEEELGELAAQGHMTGEEN